MKSKKIFILISLVIFLGGLINLVTFAQENTATSSSEKDIEILKEKIASKVAELRQENNQAFSGRIININNKQIEIKDNNEQKILVKLDESLTKYYQIKNNQKKEINFSDLKKDDYIIVTGIATDKEINADSIFIDEKYLVDFGQIIEINRQEYWLKVLTLTNENLILDVETFTKQVILNIKNLQLETIGFSKIKEGDMINFVVKDEKSKRDRFSA